MSEHKLHLKITTHEKVVFDADVDEIYSRSMQGEFGILPDHIPFMCALDIGVTKIVIGSEVQYFAIMGGVFQLKDNQALILAQTAENGKDIDATRAKEAKERAQARLTESSDDIDIKRAEIALARAIIRLKAASGN
ncbi:MAG TPA: F0F1 ATP synthase subunit epsilon [Candidatus Gastranaerophilaceae bacterium]|nr:F0F1 ATP synthase subunit epsilon [Candidatus Gastranaerophilaceae bacterium]HPT40959.1 F0F1 ATP synthase subunit epsilon [Candidatus Gastranaerophilaceae bacterium]